MLADFTTEELRLAAGLDPAIAEWLASLDDKHGYFQHFKPRPDNPAEYDQQSAFVNARDRVSFLIGGNAAGTTECACYKAAQFMVRHQAPPRVDTPFWILSNTYDTVCDTIWKEKFIDHGHLPACEIDWKRISWRDGKKNHPDVVPLKPWKGSTTRNNWAIHFKSYDQGREAMQSKSIGGFMFSEQFPHDLFVEVLRGSREYMFPGGQFAEFTPIDPELCAWVEDVMQNPPEGFNFYRANTAKNTTLAKGWAESFFGSVPDELLATRLTGALATFEGMIYQAWNPAVHVTSTEFKPPEGCRHALATDWGSSEEHPHVSLVGCEDGGGTWWIYDEYFSVDQTKTLEDHAAATIAMLERWGWPAKDFRTKDAIIKRRIVPDAEHSANYADPSRPGNMTEYTLRGLPTISARNSVIDGINHVRSMLKVNPATGQPRIFVSPRCKRLIAEMRKYRWMRGNKSIPGIRNPRVAVPEPLKKDDDACDTLRYLLYSRAILPGMTPARSSIPKSDRESVRYNATAEKFGIQFKR